MRKLTILLAILALLLSLGGACAPTPADDASAAATVAAAEATEAAAQATKAAAAQAIVQATQMALELPTDTPAPSPSQRMTPTPLTTVPSPPIPSSEPCAGESKPFWHWQGPHVEIKDFFFTTSSVGFAIGDPYTLLRTEDGGSCWTVWPIDSPHLLNAIYFSDQEIGWVAGDSGTILRTTDGGITWQPQQTSTKADLFVIKFLDDKTGWAAGSNGTLLRTTDGGASWSKGATSQQINIVDLTFIDAQEGYLVGYAGIGPRGYVLHTSDGGVTWEDTDFWGSVPEAIYAAKGETTWIAGGWTGGNIWKDIGHDSKTGVVKDLRAHSVCISSHFRYILFSDAQRGWAVGDCGLAISTQDGGEHWQSIEIHENTYWKMLRFTSEQNAVLAGYSYTDGIQVAHSSDGGETWSPASAGGP
jgi:photosystem II stability/assembly factor-like uncharacterized protein